MTDRVSHLTVALTDDFRTDDVEAIVSAIRLLRGVAGVTLGEPTSPGEWIERRRIQQRLAIDILGLLDGSKRVVVDPRKEGA